MTASPTLYDIFVEEARGYLQTLIDSQVALVTNPATPIAFETTRAAHTLAGIAATVGLMPLHQLASALEHALLRREHAAKPDSIEGLETVRQAIFALESMFAGLVLQRAPDDESRLIAALEDIFHAPLVESAATTGDGIPSSDAAVASEAAVETPVPQDVAQLPRLTDELDEQLLPIFLEEAGDQLRDLTMHLRAWRADPADGAAPHAIARLLHTFKGNARMAGALNLGEVTHLLETRVDEAMRAGAEGAAVIDEIESGCDTLALAVEHLRAGPQVEEPAAEANPLAEAAAPSTSPWQRRERRRASDAAAAPSAEAAPAVVEADGEGEIGGLQATLRVRADLIDRLVNEAGELSIARARIEGEMRSLKGSLLDLTENVIRLRRQLREIEIQAEGQIQARVAQAHDGEAEFDPLELDRFTRFQELTRFMAESVNDVATVQQSLLKNLDDANAAILAQARLNRGLQQELMGVRMLPFASQAERFYRIVRQTAKEVGKRASLDLVGGQVEIDRSVLDKMLGPVEHMLRNAVTHGLESREQRLAAGKEEAGEIALSLVQEGNEIILSLSDDGRGLDAPRIRERAEAMGLLQPGQAIEPGALLDFIFRPGFSTAAELSQLAGRGVGMDVVKTEVTALGGRIEIATELGRGTTFRLYLPLTLAVTPTLLVRAGPQLYAVPSTMIEQVLELKDKQLAILQEKGEAEWQGHHYPLYLLSHLLGAVTAQPEVHRRYWVLLLRSGSQRVAVQVDELRGNQEVVVKNIGAQLARVVGIAGATVLGDGRVVLILNPVALASRGVVSLLPSAEVAAAPVVVPETRLPTVMVVDDSLTVRKITSRLLAREGYQVMLAKDGVDALEQLVDDLPDVILSDIEMPRMDGFDFVRNLRADERLRGLPVIMITSRTAEKHRNYAFEIGANHYLGKPYDEDELLGLVAGYCKKAH
ncbi:MAG: hybrid sensor histidine kinase/response regulator [Azonexus sp.]|uniref:hybrid sensor histidine kinase/response regulator n=1 Tax=Azonexus sp. TaxID=1872668 RepID=UPI002835C28B|nr:hybrid sensor histidine kinase/response regulator [Azonexus sp.]MDR0777197.1 hybrid sensor histidine kinase/response regulator [Azonexus sp.]